MMMLDEMKSFGITNVLQFIQRGASMSVFTFKAIVVDIFQELA